MTSSEFRNIADEKMSSYTTNTVLVYLLYVAILGMASGTFIGSFIIAGPLTLGLVMFLAGVSNKENPPLETLFKGFENFVNAMVVFLLQEIFVFLWSLLLIIPGIIMGYAYSMSFFILKENPTIDPMQALRKSQDMMRGHKWRLFCLHFSYIGWIILCFLTFGILFLWVGPKMMLATYEFYLNLKKTANVEEVPFKELR